jgi:hypothetical protein
MSLDLNKNAVTNFINITDKDGDGFITPQELTNSINNNIYNPLVTAIPELLQNPNLLPLKPENIIIYDLDGDGRFNQHETNILLEAYLNYLAEQIVVPNSNSKRWIEQEFERIFSSNNRTEPMDIQNDNVHVNQDQDDESFQEYLEDIINQLGPVEQHETVDVNINGKGIDILGGDGDNPRTTISDFLRENTDNSIVINVIDERNDGSKFSTIYLYNKDVFIDQLNNSKVFPCREANNLLNTVIRDEPLYSFARLINRRINVHKEELDDFLNNHGNIFINLIKLPDTYPTIASYEVVVGNTESWLGALHCNSGAEPEQIWSVSIATHGGSSIPEGGRKTKTKTKKYRKKPLRKNNKKTKKQKKRKTMKTKKHSIKSKYKKSMVYSKKNKMHTKKVCKK